MPGVRRQRQYIGGAGAAPVSPDLPALHGDGKTPGRSLRSVPWLREQWKQVLALRSVGVPVHGFTWFPLTDAVRVSQSAGGTRTEADGQGLYDLARDPRPAAAAYRELIERWSVILGARSDAPVQMQAGESA